MSIRKIFALAAALPLPALADISFYGGLGVGGTRVEEDVNISIEARATEGSPPYASAALDKFEGTDVAYRVFAGMRFWTYLGLEIGYVNLGEPDKSLDLAVPADPPLNEIDVALKLTDEIDGFEAYLVGALPLNDKWEAFAKLGVIDWESTFTIRNAFADVYPPSGDTDIPVVSPPSSKTDTDGTDLAGGIGANYRATENMLLRGEGTWYDIDDTERVWFLGLSLIYEF